MLSPVTSATRHSRGNGNAEREIVVCPHIMEELDLTAILKQIGVYKLTPVERVLVAHTGTVQLLLSLWWNEAVIVELKSPQARVGDLLYRKAALKLANAGTEVAYADSVIDLRRNNRAVIEDVLAGQLGIGQIALKHGILTSRRMLAIEIRDNFLCRKYVMEGAGLHYEIEELFPRSLYKHLRA